MGVKRIWTDEQKADIKYLYEEEGWTIKQIEKKYKSGHGNISRMLDEMGVKKKFWLSKNRLLKEDYFENIDCPEKAYYLGLLFTDGNISPDSENIRAPMVRIELVETDIDILERLKKDLKSESTLKYNKRANREHATYAFGIRNQKIADDLAKWNIVPNKTYEVDEIIIPENYKIDFLRGFIDGDGSLYWSNNSFHINVCGHSRNIIGQIADLGNELIGKEKKTGIQCNNGVNRYTWHGIYARQLAKILYENCSIAIERKRELAMLAIEEMS